MVLWGFTSLEKTQRKPFKIHLLTVPCRRPTTTILDSVCSMLSSWDEVHWFRKRADYILFILGRQSLIIECLPTHDAHLAYWGGMGVVLLRSFLYRLINHNYSSMVWHLIGQGKHWNSSQLCNICWTLCFLACLEGVRCCVYLFSFNSAPLLNISVIRNSDSVLCHKVRILLS